MEHPAYSQLRPVTPSAGVVLCDNPSYSALEGTNSWIIRAPGDRVVVIVRTRVRTMRGISMCCRRRRRPGARRSP